MSRGMGSSGNSRSLLCLTALGYTAFFMCDDLVPLDSSALLWGKVVHPGKFAGTGIGQKKVTNQNLASSCHTARLQFPGIIVGYQYD